MSNELNPHKLADWGPSIRFVYTSLVPGKDVNAPRRFDVGLKYRGNLVVSVKFGNQGTNSRMYVGSQKDNVWEVIPDNGYAEISFGTGWPNHMETEFDVKFEPIAAGAYEHKGLAIEAVVNCK
jgi:hypothetical protein